MGGTVQPGGGVLTGASLAALQAAVNGSVAFPRNLLDGGDFTTNPCQRNIPGLASGGILSAAIANTPTYFADRWFAVGGASSAALMALVADTSLAGFSQALQVYRQSGNANTAQISFGQVLESLDTIKLQGQQITFSFWAKALAGFTSVAGELLVQIIYGTGTNQSAANLVAGTWTAQTTLLNVVQQISGAMTRYSFTATLPTNATQLAVLISFTPVGTAGANDGFQVQGLQLEAAGSASNFEHRDIEVEYGLAQRYCLVIPEPANGVVVAEGGCNVAANSQVFLIDMPTLMRAAPTVTVSVGSFKVAAAAAAAAATGLAAGATHIPTAITLTSTLTETVGLNASLQGGGGNGYIIASADF